MLRLLTACLFALLPSRLKVFLLRRRGHAIDPSAYIGLSLLWVDRLIMGPQSRIGHGNLLTRVKAVTLDHGARIGNWNRITAAPLWQKGHLHLHERASITLRHYLDVADRIEIGHDTIVAGHRSTFFTHSKGLDPIDYTQPIVIGEWCYIGSNVLIPPGVTIAHHCFVGMGSVVVGDHGGEPYRLLAGNPATARKELDPDAAYFRQEQLDHPGQRAP